MVRIEEPKLILIESASNHLSVRIDGFYRIGLHDKLWTIDVKSKNRILRRMERFEEQWGIFSENARQAPPLPMVGFAWFAVRKKWEGGGGCDRQTDGQTDRRTDRQTDRQ